MDQGGGVERPLDVLVAQLAPGEAAQVVVDEGEQSLDGVRLPLVGGPEEARDVADIELGITHRHLRR